MHNTSRKVLLLIVLSQFLCTTLWFGGNAVIADLINELHLFPSALASITSSVQLGFIAGTLAYAVSTIADRFNPSKVFLLSAVLASLSNFVVIFSADYSFILVLRFFTGFFLAGIYPVGMKIAADYFEKGLGKALGFLVGALVFGTSFPHLLKSLTLSFSWKYVIVTISLLALIGGSVVGFCIPPGPHRKKMARPNLTLFLKVFKAPDFRSAAFGYFGHMWELYTFWAFIPVMISTYQMRHISINYLNTSFLAFTVIAAGAVACFTSGLLSSKLGPKRTAFIALLCSGICCVISPFIFQLPLYAFIGFLLFWGWMVVADSPMFSTLIAQNAVMEEKGTALTIVTSIGFAITIVSIFLLNELRDHLKSEWLYVILAPGPLFGLIAMSRKKR